MMGFQDQLPKCDEVAHHHDAPQDETPSQHHHQDFLLGPFLSLCLPTANSFL